MEYLSYISCRLGNAIVNDRIAVAMLYINEKNEVEIFVSHKRMDMIESLITHNVFQLFQFYIDGFTDYVDEGKANFEFVEHERIHQNGLIEISKPSPIAGRETEGDSYAKQIFIKHFDKDFKEKN